MKARALVVIGVAGAAAFVATCGRERGRADTAAAADSAVQAARAVVDSSVPLPDTLTSMVPAGGAPSAAPAKRAPVQPAPPASRARTPARTAPAKPPATTTPPAAGARPTPAPARLDTVRGQPAVVGSAPFTQVALRPATGGSVTITGPLATEIGRASGADVWVRGTRTDRGLEATDYRVRTVDGVPALDGVLVVDGETVYLRLADGSRRGLRAAPAALRAEAGSRVWVTGGVDQPVAAFGVLRPRD